MTDEKNMTVLAAGNAGTTERFRAAVELVKRREVDNDADTDASTDAPLYTPAVRVSRRPILYHLTTPKVLPACRQRAMLLKEAIDDPDRPAHAMLTIDPHGHETVWKYERGTATLGVRYYQCPDGTRKRLDAPHLRRMMRTLADEEEEVSAEVHAEPPTPTATNAEDATAKPTQGVAQGLPEARARAPTLPSGDSTRTEPWPNAAVLQAPPPASRLATARATPPVLATPPALATSPALALPSVPTSQLLTEAPVE